MDGLYPSSGNQEIERSAGFMRHRILRINTSSAGLKNPGDASSYGNVAMSPAFSTNQALGPHFVMAAETPDGSKTYGFEFFLFGDAAGGWFNTGETPATPPFTVVVWELIGNATANPGAFAAAAFPLWASFNSITGVALQTLYHSFDVNATALRFQITSDTGAEAALNRSIAIGFCEL